MRYRGLFLAVVAVLAAGIAALAAGPDRSQLSVRITSPLGRTGIPEKIRIVAQVQTDPGVVLEHVRFFVDGVLLRDAAGEPPYAAEWIDANPFGSNEITVEAADDRGNTARDHVVLKPLEVAEETRVTSVLLETAVQDPTGRFVAGLRPADFDVREDGASQRIELMRQEEVPSTFAVLVDSSQSMSRRTDLVRQAAARLAGYMRPKDRMLVVPFSKHLEAVTGPTDDAATIGQAISAINPSGGTAIVDSLVELAPHLKNVEGRRAIVLITDGYDEHSTKDAADAIDAVKAAQATVYVVGIGGVAGISLKGERFLRQLAQQTGGRVFLPSREDELPTVDDTIASDVQHRYMLTYTPSNQEVDGTWRAIEVSTTNPKYKVITRSGYFAPKPAPIKPSIEFTITDTEQRFLNVEAGDLTVKEAGVPQTIESFEEAVSPVSIILAIDGSGSMKKAADAVKDAARRFVMALRPEDKMALVLFADRSQFAHDFATEREWSLKELDRYQAKGGTALYDALSDAFVHLRSVQGRRVVVVLTDGRDEDNAGKGPGSTHTLQSVLDLAKQSEAVLFGIGLGPGVDRDILQTLADSSGGEAYFPQDPSTLDGPYQRIIENLRRRWVISYTSTNSKRDGAWRPVVIETRFPNAVVHSLGGYFGPAK